MNRCKWSSGRQQQQQPDWNSKYFQEERVFVRLSRRGRSLLSLSSSRYVCVITIGWPAPVGFTTSGAVTVSHGLVSARKMKDAARDEIND